MSYFVRKNVALPLVATLSLGMTGMANAQEGLQARGTLEEIVVTAQRRAESAQTVPISVTALSGGAMEQARIDGVRDLNVMTPGLNVNQRSVVWAPYIRGIGTLDITAGQEAGVATYVDGVYLSSPYGSNLSFNNIERVEVLKGPQGTLFGRNATGGLIHIITKDPSQEAEMKGKVSVGNYETRQGQLYLAGPLTDSLAADLAINYRDQGRGYGTNVALGERIPGSDELGLRSKWVYEPSDTTKVTVIGDYQRQEGMLGNNRSTVPGSVFVAGPGVTFSALGDYQDIQQDVVADAEIEIWGGSIRLDQSFGAFDFQSTTAYREVAADSLVDNDALPIHLVHFAEDLQVESFTQEFQLSSNSEGAFNWILGAFYMDDRNGYMAPSGITLSGLAFADPITGNPASVNLIHTVKTESTSIFAEGTFDLSDRTRLTLGARYTQDKKSFAGRTQVNLEDGTPFVTVPSPSDSATWREPTWRVALEHDLAQDILVYASYNKGFRSGTYNTVQVTGVPVDPEFVDAYELGFKSYLFDRRLRLNGALFYNDYTDLQLVINRGTTIETLNAGQADIMGLELEGEAIVTDNLSMRFGLAYLDTEYKEFGDTGCTVRLPSGETAGVVCDPAGNPVIRAPEYTLNAGFLYEVPISTGSVGVSMDYFWTDEFNWEPDGRLVEPAYGRLNGQLFWSSVDERYRVTLWARNLTDEEYSTFTVGQPGIADQYTPAAPRTFGLEFSFNL
ncbi:MAG: TonB-dependent receptor [Porticoccaceae bacterium]